MNYLYVKLNPAGESAEGVEAWKLINKNGCFLYILFTCGNAFYPNGDAVIVKGGARWRPGRWQWWRMLSHGHREIDR